MLTVRFTITADMLYRAQRALSRNITWIRIGTPLLLVVFEFFMVVGYLAGSLPFTTWLRYNWWLALGFPLFFIFGVPLLSRWGAKRTWTATPIFHGEQIWVFSPDGFEHSTSLTSTRMAWPSVIKAVESQEFVLLFLNKMMAQFIPKVAFVDERQLELFRDLLTTALGTRARLHQRSRSLAAT